MDLQQFRERLATEVEPSGDSDSWMVAYDYWLDRDELELAAAAINRAFGLKPHDAAIRAARRATLDELAVEEWGFTFRYIPEGGFLMGADDGDEDERPVHAVDTGGCWLADATVTWAQYCELLAWRPPPAGDPVEDPEGRLAFFFLHEMNKIRRQYCGSTHDGEPTYDRKPMVAVSWSEALDLADALSERSSDAIYDLPTEAEWEKAARGGLIGKRFPWGDEPPSDATCQFDRERPELEELRKYPANDYGLYEMAGGVWEWTLDPYDAWAYQRETEPDSDQQHQHVLRGGAWTDCAEALRVSFRMSSDSNSWRDEAWGGHRSPNIGFRLCRRRRNAPKR